MVAAAAPPAPRRPTVGEEGADQQGQRGRPGSSTPSTARTTSTAAYEWWCSAVALSDERRPRARRVTRRSGAHPWAGPTCEHVRRRALDQLPERPCTSRAPRRPPPAVLRGEIGAAFSAPCGQSRPCGYGLGHRGRDRDCARAVRRLFQHTVPDWDRLPGAAIIRGPAASRGSCTPPASTGHVAGVPDSGRRGLRPRCADRVACGRARQVQAVLAGLMLAPFINLFLRLGIRPRRGDARRTLGVSAGALIFFRRGCCGRASVHHRLRLQRPDRRRDGRKGPQGRLRGFPRLHARPHRRRRAVRRRRALLRVGAEDRLYLVLSLVIW